MRHLNERRARACLPPAPATRLGARTDRSECDGCSDHGHLPDERRPALFRGQSPAHDDHAERRRPPRPRDDPFPAQRRVRRPPRDRSGRPPQAQAGRDADRPPRRRGALARVGPFAEDRATHLSRPPARQRSDLRRSSLRAGRQARDAGDSRPRGRRLVLGGELCPGEHRPAYRLHGRPITTARCPALRPGPRSPPGELRRFRPTDGRADVGAVEPPGCAAHDQRLDRRLAHGRLFPAPDGGRRPGRLCAVDRAAEAHRRASRRRGHAHVHVAGLQLRGRERGRLGRQLVRLVERARHGAARPALSGTGHSAALPSVRPELLALADVA